MDCTRDFGITTLAENYAHGRCLGQCGLSFLLDFIDARGDDRRIVFDTGRDRQAFLRNVKTLQVDLSKVDAIVLSHGHLDHTAATVEVARAAGGTKVYAHPHTFLPRFFTSKRGKRRRIGVPRGEGREEIEAVGGEVLLLTDPYEVAPSLWTTGQVKRRTAFERELPLSEGERVSIRIGDAEVDDHILDDQALWTTVEGVGPVMITGCAHAGLVNTVQQVQTAGNFTQLHGLVGGTHLVGRSDEYLAQTIRELQTRGLTLVSPCHCTGFKATTRLWREFPDAFVLNYSGRTLRLGEAPRSRLF
jgi:7,8-dihydropterin-6-yl-methyl-4-(beta-D-ribofuranosyl)aminobenzene 5'-phosphate synthase